MGMFMAISVTAIILLLAMISEVAPKTMVYRGTVVFFIFGMLGTILGSFLEVMLMPSTTEKESDKLKEEIALDDKKLESELGDLLDNYSVNENPTESFGTPTDEFTSGKSSGKDAAGKVMPDSNSATAS